MSSVIIAGNTSGTITLDAPAVSGTTVLTLPTTSGTVITTGNIPTGSVVQVVQVAKTDAYSASINSTWTDITGLSASITPSSASNKILVMVSIGSVYGGNNSILKLVRGSTDIFVGDAATSRTQGTLSDLNAYVNGIPASFSYLDSPSTTSSTTYKMQGWVYNGFTLYINQGGQDAASAFRFRTPSSIILMEIKG
jgi:hypothetical protein